MGRKLLLMQLIGIIPLMLPNFVKADSALGVIFSEIQTGTEISAAQEFIEICNCTTNDVDISEWRVEYFSASSDMQTASRTIQLDGLLQAGSRYLLAANDYLPDMADIGFGATLAKSGGHLRLVSGEGQAVIVHDLVGWGTAEHPEAVAAMAPGEGQSLGRVSNIDGKMVDSDNNFSDFEIVDSPSPEGRLIDPLPDTTEEPDSQEEAPEPEVAENDNQTSESRPRPQVVISELMPDPESPQTDGQHEYVELYNPSSESLDLDGLILQTGNNFSYEYVFDELSLKPGEYQAFYIAYTDLILANSGGKARLLDQDGTVLSEVVYPKSLVGQSWSLVGGEWKWTTTLTPGMANVITVPAVATKKSSTKTTAKRAASKKSTKVKAASTASNDNSLPATTVDPEEQRILHPVVVASVGLLTLGYAAYEYRKDVANRIHRFRRHRAARRAARAQLEGR
jgi:Lamin Tail Domain